MSDSRLLPLLLMAGLSASCGNAELEVPVLEGRIALVTSAPSLPAAAPPVYHAPSNISASVRLEVLAQTSGILLPVRTATEKWIDAKVLTTTDASWKTWLSGRRDLVNRWFAKPRDRHDLVAGYPNDMVDLKTGAFVAWNMDLPEPQATAAPVEIKYRQAWAAVNRQYNIARTLDAARFYRLTGDVTLAETAARQLDFYAENYMRWPERKAIGNARMFGQSLDEAMAVLEMLEAARTLQSFVGAARATKWREGLFQPIAKNLQTYSYGTLNNIDLWCAVGVAAIGMHLNDSALLETGTSGPRGIAAVLRQGTTRDGIWFEGSFAYNNFVLAALARLFDIASVSEHPDFVQRYAPDVQRMLLAPILFRFDDGTLPMPSDTRFAVAAVDKGTHAALYRHVPTTFGVQQATATKSWATLLDAPPSGIAAVALPPAQTVHAEDARMMLLRHRDWQLFIHYGQRTVNHAQEEALTYELVQSTTSITRDAGTATSYSSPLHLEYFSKGVGNNVPLIDGMGQERWSPGEVLSMDAATASVDLLQPTYRKDVSVRRTFQLGSSGMTETTRISVQPPNQIPRRLGVIFNTHCSVNAQDPRAGLPVPSVVPHGSQGFKHWTHVTRQEAQATWTAHLDCSGKPYELTITGPVAHTVYRASAPATPVPATRNAIYVEANASAATFVTRIRSLH